MLKKPFHKLCVFTIEDLLQKFDIPVDENSPFDTEEERMKAKAEWESLRELVGWKRSDLYALKKLKHLRREHAHPTRPPDIIKDSLYKLKKLKSNDRDFQKDVKSFEKLLTMYEKLQTPKN